MVLTERERLIAIVGGSVIGAAILLGLMGHYVSVRHEIADEIETKSGEKHAIDAVILEQTKARDEFKQMIDDGLKSSEAEAKGQIRDALEQWAPSSGINEKTLSDGQVIHEADFDQISFKLSGWGPQATIAKLLNQCEFTTLPLRVSKITLTPVAEGKDYVYFELTVSTICRSEKDKNARTRAGADLMQSRGARS